MLKVLMAGAAVLLAMLVSPIAAGAATINVNTVADEYGPGTACSLREAITAARTNAAFGGCSAGTGGDTIILPAGNYAITRAGAEEDLNSTGDFDIGDANDLEIRPAGPDARVNVDGNGLDRVFDKSGIGDLNLTSIRISGGVLTAIEDGGGIRSSVGLTVIENVTLDNNQTNYEGGGIAVYGNLTGINSTISGNRSGGSGGGIYAPGGSSVTLRSSTLVSNHADFDGNGNGFGGGFRDAGATSVNFTNVLNAGNTAAAPVPPDKANDCSSGPFYFPRYTLQTQLMGPASCLVGFPHSSNIVTDDAKYGPLAFNGGQTPTHNLLPGSPAIGAGGTAPPDECPGIDQNGVGRPAGTCDIGAVQFVPVPGLVITKLLPKKKVIRLKRSKPITVELRNDGTGPGQQVKVCLKLNKAARKGLKVKGKACRTVGTIAVGQIKRAKIRLMARPNAKKKAYQVRATFSGSNVPAATRTFKVRVK